MSDMAVRNPWDEAAYQRVADARGEAFDLAVRFEDGTELRIDVRRLVDLEEPPVWDDLVVRDGEVELSTNDGPVEISWLDLRALTDEDFARHLAERADEQARQVGRRLRLLRE